jgi:hypothetical protein
MTVTTYLSNIADSISSISISGVTVKDRDLLAGSWVSIPNVLYPNPDGWITGFSVDYKALMQGTTAPLDLSYTLNYRFLGVQVGDMATFGVSYSALIDKVMLIINAIITNPAPYSGRVEMKLGDVSLGAKDDPAGNQYFGADFALLITEMQN